MLRILTLALLLSVVQLAQADTNDEPGRKSFDLLWSIKGNTNNIYLLGSVHLLPHGTRGLPQVVNAAYLTSDLIVFESDLFLIGSVDFEGEKLAQARYPAGMTIGDELPADLLLQVEERASALNLPIRVLERYRPWFYAQVLATAQFQRDGYPLDNGVDVRLYKRSLEDIKLTAGLTPPEQHLASYANMDKEQTEAFLRSALVDLKDTRAQVSRILDIYQNADLDLLETLSNEMQDLSPSLYQRLIVDRNQQWMSKFEAYRQADKNILVVVGAMHLVGEQGLLQQFRNRGWKPTVPKYRGFRPPE